MLERCRCFEMLTLSKMLGKKGIFKFLFDIVLEVEVSLKVGFGFESRFH